jgi:hypothetical protein
MPGVGMTLRLIAGLVAIACGSACGLVASFTNFRMIDEVNGRLPEEERFKLVGWYRREYKRFYPEGRLLIRVRILSAIMLICMVVAAWCFGVVPR